MSAAHAGEHGLGVTADPHPGDLVCYDFDNSNFATSHNHVGMYLGAGYMIDAPSTGDYVKIQLVSDDGDFAKLHVEWESGSVPAYVWPTEGDRVKLWGQWIWDCGHWGQGITTDQSNPQGSLIGTGDYLLPGQVEGGAPGNLRGEQTELHPMQAIVVNRKAPNRAAAPETQTDVFVSSAGTHALGEERCAARSAVAGQPISGPDFTACVNSGPFAIRMATSCQKGVSGIGAAIAGVVYAWLGAAAPATEPVATEAKAMAAAA